MHWRRGWPRWATPFKSMANSKRSQPSEAQRILVPIKGEPLDEDVIRLASDVAKRSGGTAYILYVIEVDRSLPVDAQLDGEMERASLILERAEELGRQKGSHFETCLLQARNVGPAVVEEVIERGADLLILGMSYKHRFGEFSLGDAIPYILKNSPSRVWLYRESIPVPLPVSLGHSR